MKPTPEQIKQALCASLVRKAIHGSPLVAEGVYIKEPWTDNVRACWLSLLHGGRTFQVNFPWIGAWGRQELDPYPTGKEGLDCAVRAILADDVEIFSLPDPIPRPIQIGLTGPRLTLLNLGVGDGVGTYSVLWDEAWEEYNRAMGPFDDVSLLPHLRALVIEDKKKREGAEIAEESF